MSFSYRKLCLGCVAAVVTSAAWGQQSYFIPRVEVRGEGHTNRELRPEADAKQSSNSYRATFETLTGIRSNRGQIDLRPRIAVQEFPDRGGADRFEAFTDLSATYRMPKGLLGLTGSFSRQDVFNSELGESDFDDLDPENPLPPDVPTGAAPVDRTRVRYTFEPRFSHQLSTIFRIDSKLQYESQRFESDDIEGQTPNSGGVGYDAPYAEILLVRAFGPRTEAGLGTYATRYEPDNEVSVTDSFGGLVSFRQRWSETASLAILFRAEKNDVEFSDPEDPLLLDESSTNWGIEVLGQRKLAASELRYSVGRFLRPTSLGNRRTADQIQLQYSHLLSQLTKINATLNLQKDQSVSDADDETRERARLSLAWERKLTQNWTFSVGYRYSLQDQGENVSSADNHTGFISVGYRGLDPRTGVR